MSTKRLRINFQIRVPEVRVIGHDGAQLGVMPTTRAQQMADAAGLDLVEVSANAQPPVCKILDYGAYQYQQEKKERKQRAKVKKVEVKGIRLSLKIGQHDLEMRKNQSLKFLKDGNKVKVELILRGRERAYAHRGADIMNAFADSLAQSLDITIDQNVSRQGNRLFLVVGKK